MVFITTGTTKFSFRRMDEIVAKLATRYPKKQFIYQSPTSTLLPGKNLTVTPEMKYKDLINLISKAECVITHGGPATIFQVLKHSGNLPVVIPRSGKLGEHVNNHQIEFTRYLESQGKIKAYYPDDTFTKLLKMFIHPVPIKSKRENLEHIILTQKLISYVNSAH